MISPPSILIDVKPDAKTNGYAKGLHIYIIPWIYIIINPLAIDCLIGDGPLAAYHIILLIKI